MSCCAAVTELLRGRSLLPFEDKLPKLWESLMLVMDDVHEGTRVAATNTSLSLSKVCYLLLC
jgi:proteasome component ECM29